MCSGTLLRGTPSASDLAGLHSTVLTDADGVATVVMLTLALPCYIPGPPQGHPGVPDLFVWRDLPTNTSVLFAHDDGYGGGVHIAPNGHALYCAWNRDNSGHVK